MTFDTFKREDLGVTRRKYLAYLHPDKKNVPDDEKCQYKRELINFAYRILENPQLRSKYNTMMNKNFEENSLTRLPKYDIPALYAFENRIKAVVMTSSLVGNNAKHVFIQRTVTVSAASMFIINFSQKHYAG